MARFQGGLLIPDCLPDWGYRPALTNGIGGANAVGEGFANVFRVPLSGTLEKVALYHTGSGVGTIRASIQTVTSAGVPSGTPLVYREFAAPAAGAWYETGLLTDDGTDLGATLAVTQGQLRALVLEYTAYTSGQYQIYVLSGDGMLGFPYTVGNFGSGWVKLGTPSYLPNMTLLYAGGEYETPRWCLSMNALEANVTTLTTASTPDEAGAAIVPPWDALCDGAFLLCRPETSCTVTLYDSAGTALAQNTMDPDVCGYFTAALNFPATPTAGRYYWFSWDEVELTGGNEYVVAVRPTGAGNVLFYDIPHASAAIMAGTPGGTSGALATRSGGSGVFTTSSTRKGIASLNLAGID